MNAGRIAAVIVTVIALAVPALRTASAAAPTRPVGAVTAATADPTIAAAGDIACGTSDANYNGGNGTATACRQKYTSDLLVNGGYAAVLTLGDNMQSDPSPTGFATVFNPTWGRVKGLIHPEAGNHDYGYTAAKGYFGYFGAAAGDPTKGYYSFDLGAWHVVALNSNCAKITGGCASGGAQDVWLRSDLGAHAGRCILAFDHHPRYSSGHEGDSTFMSVLYQDLLNAHADVLLSGHSHDYERFQPQDNASHLDTANGITQFVVGTGGAFFTGLGTRHANSVTSQNSTFGVLALTLHASSYDWRFVPEAGKTWTDSGTRSCHAVAPPSNDFAMTANPSTLSAQQGKAATTTIGTTVTSGSAQPVTLSATGQPTDTTVTFTPATVTAGASSTMTVSTAATTPTGTQTLTVTGTGTTATHTTAVTLSVTSTSSTRPALVQSDGATQTAAATALTASLPTSSAAGHLLVAVASVYTGLSNRITSVTDSAGNTWTRAGSWAVSGHNSDGEVWFAANAKPVTTISTHTASAAVVALTVMDFSGVATSSPLDVVTGTSNTSTSPSSGPVTTGAPGELVVGFVAGHASAQAMTITTPGVTALGQRRSAAATTASVVGGYLVSAAAAQVSITGTFAAAVYWAAGIAAFRPATP
jgi:hypothetical protein